MQGHLRRFRSSTTTRMGKMYRIRRTDANQKQIVAKFRKLGASVAIISEMGSGLPDLIIAYPGGFTALIEVKDGAKPLSQQKLTFDEQEFFEKWPGHLYIIRSEDEVVALINKIKEKEQKDECN